jgi:4a-hydroxytetrahydrobiopterin dehydratase
MAQLKELVCISCSSNLPPMSETEITELKPQIPDWKIVKENEKNCLQRVYFFSDFKSALAFSQMVGEEAEIMGHHPALLLEWGKVTVTWWTHAIGGLHRNDFIMAARTDALAIRARQ